MASQPSEYSATETYRPAAGRPAGRVGWPGPGLPGDSICGNRDGRRRPGTRPKATPAYRWRRPGPLHSGPACRWPRQAPLHSGPAVRWRRLAPLARPVAGSAGPARLVAGGDRPAAQRSAARPLLGRASGPARARS